MNSGSKRRPHESARGHVTGGAIYTDDQRLPVGMLSMYPVLSTIAKGKITKVDTSLAETTEGFITTLTYKDVLGVNNTGPIVQDEILLPIDEVSYWGQPILWIIAKTEAQAKVAAQKVVIEYMSEPPILTIEQAIASQSYQGNVQIIRRGDLLAGVEAADHHLEGELFMKGQDHFYLETQASWTIPDMEGNYQVYSSTQHPSETQHIVSRVLGLSDNQIVVTCLRMGGGFGGKETQGSPVAALTALAAQKTRSPVRLKLKRQHDMIFTGKRHGFLGRYKVGFTKEGKITALEVNLYADGGWSLDLSPPILLRAVLHIDNAYYLPNLEIYGRIVKTNKVSNTAFRGFGGPQGMLVIEDIMGMIAQKLHLAPEIVRESNFYHGVGETNTTHYGQEIYDNRLTRIWHEVTANANFAQRKVEIAQYNQVNAYKKRGIAVTPVKFGISFNKTQYNQAGALLLIYTDGSIQLNHGGTEMGQGLHTKMLQVAAKSLGVKIERFRLMNTSTDKVPNTSATAASSGSDLNGQAIKCACETLKSRLASVASKILKLDRPEEMIFEDDWVYCSSYPQARVNFEDLVKTAYNERISLSATGYYRTPDIHWNAAEGKGRPFYYFSYGAAVSEVEIDGFTGTFKLRQVDILHDVGESLNPLIDQGQIEGGFVQGLGWLTMEDLVWDDQGRLKTYAPSTYKIPTIGEIPEHFNVQLLQRAAQDGVIFGSKAVGEPPFMLAISIREAIRAAIAAFGEGENFSLNSPTTPESILLAIENVKSKQGVECGV